MLPNLGHCKPEATGKPCLNGCGRRAQLRKRGLCQRCYQDKRIRRRFPIRPGGYGAGPATTRAGRKTPLPELPTMALPGTEEKVEVLEDRAQRREALWHPLDRQFAWWDERPDDESPDLLALKCVALTE